jgi:hypothetical protein
MHPIFSQRTTSITARLGSLPLILLLLFAVASCAIHPAASRVKVVGVDSQQQVARGDDDEIGWVCPMHPDQTSETPGKCPRCGMLLVRGALFEMRDYRMDFETVPAVPKAGEMLTLKFNVFHPGSGEPIK